MKQWLCSVADTFLPFQTAAEACILQRFPTAKPPFLGRLYVHSLSSQITMEISLIVQKVLKQSEDEGSFDF